MHIKVLVVRVAPYAYLHIPSVNIGHLLRRKLRRAVVWIQVASSFTPLFFTLRFKTYCHKDLVCFLRRHRRCAVVIHSVFYATDDDDAKNTQNLLVSEEINCLLFRDTYWCSW